MCRRYVSPDSETIAHVWSIQQAAYDAFPRCFNVRPGITVPVLRGDPKAALILIQARWGFIPSWWNQSKPPEQFVSVRGEDAASKPMWQPAYRSARCVIPADGWYEWTGMERVGYEPAKSEDTRQPHFVFRTEGPVGFAGLMSLWKLPGQLPVITCAILTCAASPSIARIHPHMPVVLPLEMHSDWLDPRRRTPAEINPILAQSIKDFSHYPVSKRLTNATENDEALAKPITA
jgi:putative SOS response-associated peptidase YedK